MSGNPLLKNESILEFIFGIGLILIPSIMILSILIPSYILGFQYFKYSINLEVIIESDCLKIIDTKLKQQETINKNDIQNIIYVFSSLTRINSNAFVSFSHLIIETNNKRIIIPCFVITKDEFFNHLGKFDNLIESDPYIPFIKPGGYQGLKRTPELNLSEITNKPIQLSGQYFGLIRSLIIGGLASYTFIAYFFGQTWFLVSLAITIIVSLLLCLHNKVVVANNKLIIKRFQRELNFSFTDIESITEINWSSILSLGLSDPMIKMRLIYSNEMSKTVYFFPIKDGFKTLNNKLNPT